MTMSQMDRLYFSRGSNRNIAHNGPMVGDDLNIRVYTISAFIQFC